MTSILSFARLIWRESQINLQLTGEILLKFDFSSSLLPQYDPE